MAAAGNFKIEVESPYPCWTDISYDGECIVRIHHAELNDLYYVVKRAMMEARRKLGERGKEEVMQP